jgi:UDP-glucose:(heptosyl)LPS alpha-1,3-glucosyltransferase
LLVFLMKVALNVGAVGARRGGAEKYAGILARRLAAAGHEVHVLAREVDAGELPAGATTHFIRPRSLPGFGWLRSFRFAAASARELARHDFDLVIGFAHVWRQDVLIAVGGSYRGMLDHSQARFRSPVRRALWWTGKLLNPKHWLYRLIEHKQFSRGNGPLVIAPSRLVAWDFRRWHGVPAGRIAIVPFAPEREGSGAAGNGLRRVFRRRWGLADDDVAVLFAAHNYSLKGLDPLLEAMVPVARACPQVRLVACGSRRDRRYRRRASRLGLDDRVRFLGFVDDMRECFAGSDVLASPTFYDPCSLTVLEALAAGLPVITTRANGAGELLSEGDDGFVIDSPWAVEELADRLGRLAGDAALRQAMSRHALASALRLSLEGHDAEMLEALAACGPTTIASASRRAA